MLDLELMVEGDGRLAVLHAASVEQSRASSLDEQTILDALSERGVVVGIDADAVQRVLKALHGGGRFRGPLEIAREEAVIAPAGEVTLEWVVLPDGLVLPDTTLCRFVPQEPGRDGLLVTGEPVSAPRFDPTPGECEKLMRPGDHVVRARGGLELSATAFGWIAVTGHSVAVVPAFSVSEDKTEIRGSIVADTADGTPLTPSVVRAAVGNLLGSGIFLDDDVATAIGRARAEGQPLRHVLVAVARPAKPGKEARLELLVEAKAFVVPGERLARKLPATAGEEGERFDGTPIPAAPGQDLPLDSLSGENVSVMEGADGVSTLIAGVFGDVVVDAGRVGVTPTVVVEEDGSTASVSFEPKTAHGKEVNSGMLVKAVNEAGVTHGVLGDKIDEAVAEAQRTGKRQEKLIVACATPPREAVPKSYRFHFKVDCELPEWPPGGETGLGSKSSAAVASAGGSIRSGRHRDLVRTGAMLAEDQPGQPGEPGTTVIGKPIEAPGVDIDLKAGQGVEWAAARGVFTAMHDGFPYLDGNLLRLERLMDKSQDNMQVHVRLYPPNLEGHDHVGLLENLKRQIIEVLHDDDIREEFIDAAGLNAAVEAAGAGEVVKRVLVARGSDPVPPEEGEVEFLVAVEESAGRLLDDMTMDFRERDSVKTVNKGQVIANVTEPKPGKPGFDVHGQAIGTERPAPALSTEFGDNVEVVDGKLLATINGVLEHVKDTISVSPIFVVNGDVDYDVGNIHYDGAVIVKGDVGTIFEIEVGGSLEVGGLVDGAKITCGGDLLIAGGILGKGKAEISCAGKLSAKYIENALVEVDGDMEISGHIYHSRVRCGGVVKVNGAITGGRVEGFRGIMAGMLGSEGHPETNLVAGHSFKVSQELEVLEEKLDDQETQRKKLVDVLRRLTRGQGLSVLQSLPPEKRGVAAKVVTALKQLEAEVSSLEVSIEGLRRQLQEDAVLHVSAEKGVFEGVVVWLSGRSHRVYEAVSRAQTFKDTGTGEIEVS